MPIVLVTAEDRLKFLLGTVIFEREVLAATLERTRADQAVARKAESDSEPEGQSVKAME